MNCNYCQNQFNHTTNVPRLLIFCGHSLCETCCHTIHSNNRVQCPQCLSNTFIEDINFLPKNLALLKVQQPVQDSSMFCLKHEKKIQAFCEKEKILLCVDCILQDGHRNHPVDSIKNCYLKEQSKLENMIKKLENAKVSIQEKHMQNKENHEITNENYNTAMKSMISFYSQLKEIVEREEEQSLTKISQQFKNSEVKFRQKNENYTKKLEDINECLQTLTTSTHHNQFNFLASVSTRQQLFALIETETEENCKSIAFSSTKNTIAESLIKNIEKNFKVSATSSSSSSVSHKKYDMNCFNKPIRNKTASQNQKTFAKKVSKKECTTGSNKSSIFNPQKQTKSGKQEKQKPLVKYDMNVKCDVSAVDAKESLFNSFMSNMTSFLTEKKHLYIVGGFSQDNNDIIKMNLNTYAWEKVSTLHTNRSKFGLAILDKSLFIFGGKKGKERVSDCEVWNENMKEWQTGFKLRKCRSGFGTLCIDQILYVIGGNDGESILSSVQTFNLKTGQWKRKEPMNEARDELSICLGKDNKIYAIGGFGTINQEPLKTVEVFDIKTEKWSYAPSLKFPRRALACASLADGIYAVGGFDGKQYLSSVEKFEQGGKEWVSVADLKKGRCTHSAISVFDSQQIVVSGGFDEVPLDTVERYSLISNEWEVIGKMPSARFMHGSILMTQ